MNSSIFESMGLGNLDLGYVIIALVILTVVLLVISIVSMNKLAKLDKKYKKFMQGKAAKSLETDIIKLYEDNKFMINTVEKNMKDIAILNKKLASVFQKIGLVKYDAFSHMGGKLSYSIALLDENNNGFILNSVHSTEGCYSYTKEIVAGESAVLLGVEEKQALDIAIKS